MSADEDVSVVEDAPVTELDLDEAPPTAPAPAPGQGSWRRRWRASRGTVAVGVAGALLGGALVHVVESSRAADETQLRVGLGDAGGRLLNRRLGSRRVVLLSTVAVNEGRSSLTVRGVHVEGAGAALTRTFRDEASIYPFRLEPGQTGNMPLAVTSDCDVEGRSVPEVTVDVTAEDGTQRTVKVRIPGFDELWRRSTTPDACPGG